MSKRPNRLSTPTISSEGACLTRKMIEDFFSPGRLEAVHQREMERDRQKTEMMRPYREAPNEVYMAAWRIMMSNFGAPMHPDEGAHYVKIVEGWKP